MGKDQEGNNKPKKEPKKSVKISKNEMANIDRSQGKPGDNPDVDIHLDQYVPNKELVGKSATLGRVGYHDEDDEKSGSGNKSGGGMFSMFTNLVGSKAITREDLEPVL